MPIGPDIIDHNSEVVNAFVAKSFEEKVKELADKMIKAIDNHLLTIKPDQKAKRATMQLWNVVDDHCDIFKAASDLVEKTYKDVGWSRVEIADLGYDRFDNCVQVRLYK